MANKFNNGRPGEDSASRKDRGVGRGPDTAKSRDGTANWPGLPGKTQGRSRDSSGTKKLKQSAKEEGI